MLREALYLFVWALCLCAAAGQPVSCTEEAQCPVGTYCETEAHVCKECLNCQDLKREPPLTPNFCIKSVAECGACFKGLVVDRLGDVNAACVVPTGPGAAGGTPHYVWWLGSAVFIFLALMIAIIVYIYLNPGIFEKLGGNCQSGIVDTNIRTETRASAPEALPPFHPPPYAPPQYNDIPYSSVRTESPCPPHYDNGDATNVHVEEEGPFIKPSWGARAGGARESAGRQAARVYNLPNYRRHDLPPTPESPVVTELNDNLAIHDEETMESNWVPSGPSNGDAKTNGSEAGTSSSAAAGVSLPAMLAAARDDSLIEHTPPKQLCIRPTSSNRNRDSNPGGDSSQGNFSGSQNGTPYVITQITNVVQFNRST